MRTLKIVDQPGGKGGGGTIKTRRARFKEYAQKRFITVLSDMDQIKKLANPTHYEWTEGEADQIINTMKEVVAEIEYVFKNPGKSPPVLTFEDDE